MTTVTARTKQAIRRWAGLPPSAPVALGDLLDALRAGAKSALLVELNTEFHGEPRFPIPTPHWDALELKKVADVHAECTKRVEG